MQRLEIFPRRVIWKKKKNVQDRSKEKIGKKRLEGKRKISTSGPITVQWARLSPYIKLGLASDNRGERNQSESQRIKQKANKRRGRRKDSPQRRSRTQMKNSAKRNSPNRARIRLDPHGAS
jgi:hypothetical protein